MRRRALWLLLPLAWLGCATTLDVDRARRWLETPEQAQLPPLATTASAPLSAPEGLRATSGELRAIPLRWDPVLNGEVGGYSVERAEQNEGPFLPIAAVPGRASTSFVDTGPTRWPEGAPDSRSELRDGETLYYRVRAFTPDGALGRGVSEVVGATTAPPPAPPEGLRAYSHQPREVPLTWQAASDPNVAGYVIERSPTSRGPFEPLAELPGRYQTSYLDRGLGDLRVFHYRIAAVNRAGGRGEPSAPARAVTKAEPLPPIGLRVVARQLGRNDLAWDPNVEADLSGYRLLRIRDDGEPPEPVATLPRGRPAGVDRDVGADEVIAYTVVALDEDGLMSDAAETVEVKSVGYELSATVQPDGIHLEWNPRFDEGFRGARVYLNSRFGQSELGFVDDGRFVYPEIQPGKRYRFTVVLERPDGTAAPTSSPVEIAVPRG